MSKSTFLPTGYSVPEASSSYLKFKEGATKFRVVSEAIFGYEYWTENNKPVRLKEMPKEKPEDVRLEKDGSYKIKHFWAFTVIDRNDGMIKICEITQSTIMHAMKSLMDNEDWGDPKGYDITVNRTGESLETKYTVQPSPHKALTSEEKELIKENKVNLDALFYGENPFDKEWTAPVKIVAPEEDEVNVEDVPF